MNVCILTPHLNQGWELHGQNQQKEIKRLCSRRVSALIKSLIKIVDLINFFHQIWMKCLSWPSHIMKTLHVPESRPNTCYSSRTVKNHSHQLNPIEITFNAAACAGLNRTANFKMFLKAIPKLWHVLLLSVNFPSRCFRHRFLGYMDRTNKKRSKGHVRELSSPYEIHYVNRWFNDFFPSNLDEVLLLALPHHENPSCPWVSSKHMLQFQNCQKQVLNRTANQKQTLESIWKPSQSCGTSVFSASTPAVGASSIASSVPGACTKKMCGCVKWWSQELPL